MWIYYSDIPLTHRVYYATATCIHGYVFVASD